MSYEETEKCYEGNTTAWISRTNALEVKVYINNKEETFRCDLIPLLTFFKHKIKEADWKYISQSRKEKWGYKRLEDEELFNLLNDGRIINE